MAYSQRVVSCLCFFCLRCHCLFCFVLRLLFHDICLFPFGFRRFVTFVMNLFCFDVVVLFDTVCVVDFIC